MKFWMTYPITHSGYHPDLLAGGTIARIAQAAEAAGFDGIGFSDHPAPSGQWLRTGGHDTFDPFAALSYVAASTSRIALIPNAVVLPYRNPFVVAKLAATLDVLSGGRFVLSTVVGYLKSEYSALGVDFDTRNELYDEALEVLRGVWTSDSFDFDGTGFSASGVNATPKPGHIPIWIGGNSQRTRRRVATYGDCWNPFLAYEARARATGTTRLETTADLRQLLPYLWRKVDEAGRDRAAIDIAFWAPHGAAGTPDFMPARHLEAVDELAELGVTWTGVSVPNDSVDHLLEAIGDYGSRVIAVRRS